MTKADCSLPFGAALLSTRRRGSLAMNAALLLPRCGDDQALSPPARYQAAVCGLMASYQVPGALVSVVVPSAAWWRQAFGFAILKDRTSVDIDVFKDQQVLKLAAATSRTYFWMHVVGRSFRMQLYGAHSTGQ